MRCRVCGSDGGSRRFARGIGLTRTVRRGFQGSA